MSEAPDICAHDSCTCVAAEGEYCSDYCREAAGRDEGVCACGHPDCAGTVAGTTAPTVG